MTDKNKVTYSVVVVDDEMATRWLESNHRNRRPRQGVIERYRADMAAGRWLDAGDPIRFDIFGNLIDGQHRLTALSELPGMQIPFLVIRGLASESQTVMDQGAKRTPGDQLSLSGVRNAGHIAAIVKQFLLWEDGLLFRDAKVANAAVSAPRIVEWVREHGDEIELISPMLNTIQSNDAPPSIAGAAALIFNRLDPDNSEQFFKLLARGAGTEGHPIVALDKRLQRMRREGLKMTHRDYLAMFIQAWNAWRSGKQVQKFQRPIGGRYTEDNFPVAV